MRCFALIFSGDHDAGVLQYPLAFATRFMTIFMT